MRIKRFFVVENYKNGLKSFYKKLKIKRLEKLKFNSCAISYIWKDATTQNFNLHYSDELCYSIFGIKINLEDIDWHKDKFSGFVFPMKRFDKLNVEQWFNKGIELKFPWELSRFYFAVGLGQKYLITKDEYYYKTFRKLVLDWIEKNPFLYGVNWLSTMEVAIRSINWIVSINFFSELVKNDENFKKIITPSLLQHAEYIYSFPEIYEKGLTTNHTTAGYAGLLFLSLSLKDHSRSKLWIDSAINGLERCMREQVYEDGTDFEASIPYHRLVLELFAFSAIAALARSIKFNKDYFNKLFKMFEYTSAYIDENGNAPQVGDNDSGRSLIFNALDNNPYKNEHDHSYALSIGEHLFDYKFRSQCLKIDDYISNYLPKIEKTKIEHLNITPRTTDASISFENNRSYFLKNETFSFLLSCCPLGQKGKGGHNHLDVGSFTLSINGKPIIVDAGTFTYTMSRESRNKFRSYYYHNTIYSENVERIDLKKNDLWSLKKYYVHKIENINSQEIELSINFFDDKIIKHRKFKVEAHTFTIENYYDGYFFTRMNLHPDVLIINHENNKIEFDNFDLFLDPTGNYKVVDYDYSPNYGKTVKSKSLIFSSNKFSEIKLVVNL